MKTEGTIETELQCLRQRMKAPNDQERATAEAMATALAWVLAGKRQLESPERALCRCWSVENGRPVFTWKKAE